MIASRLVMAAMLATWALPLSAQAPTDDMGMEIDDSIVFGFAPPIGSTLRYEHVRTSTLNGATTGARLTYDYRFERSGEGYLLWVELVAVEGLGDEHRARLAETVAAPMLDIAYAIELAANGAPLAIQDEERVWEHTLQGIAIIEADMRARTNIGEEERTQMLALLAATRDQTEDARRNGMLIVVSDLLALAGRAIVSDEHPVDIEIASPLGGTTMLSGTMAAHIVANDLASIETEGQTETADGLILRDRSSYHGAPSSGLVHRMERIRVFEQSDAPNTASYQEHITVRLIEEIAAGETASRTAR